MWKIHRSHVYLRQSIIKFRTYKVKKGTSIFRVSLCSLDDFTMDLPIPAYLRYWGKTKRDLTEPGDDYHLLAFHSLDVAAVASYYLDCNKKLHTDLSQFLEVDASQLKSLLVFILSLHDLGKFATAFQRLYALDDGHLIKLDADYIQVKHFLLTMAIFNAMFSCVADYYLKVEETLSEILILLPVYMICLIWMISGSILNIISMPRV